MLHSAAAFSLRYAIDEFVLVGGACLDSECLDDDIEVVAYTHYETFDDDGTTCEDHECSTPASEDECLDSADGSDADYAATKVTTHSGDKYAICDYKSSASQACVPCVKRCADKALPY